jgi:chromosome segregation ATPase
MSGVGRGMVAGPRGPRSRFSTLPAEVDDAVSLLLRELEYLGDARQKITHLEDVIVRLQQDVRINENALMLAQRNAASSNSRNSEGLRTENEKLKKEAEDMRRVLAEEKSRSHYYQADAEYWKSQAQTKQTELEELRGKLKNLLGG